MPAQNKQVRVNVTTAINASAIKRERRNGRDVIVVPSATMPDNIVMNGIRYPAEEIAKSYASLENTPAPLGHPNIEGAFVSASDPEGMVRGFVGAWNKNVRRENGRVFLDKVIDVEFASQLEGGKTVINAIDKGEPIHTSTGLFATLTATNNDNEAEWQAADIVFDHDAILIGEDGAATPDKGVGIFVNSSGKPEKVEVINSSLKERSEETLDWISEDALRAVERMQRVPLLEKIKAAIKEAVMGATAPETTTNQEEEDMDLEELSGKVEALSNTVAGLDEKIGTAVADALKPLTDQLTANAEAEKAKAEAEHEKLVNAVVTAELLDEETAKESPAAVLNALIERNKPGQATLLNGAYKPASNKSGSFQLPAGEE